METLTQFMEESAAMTNYREEKTNQPTASPLIINPNQEQTIGKVTAYIDRMYTRRHDYLKGLKKLKNTSTNIPINS